MKKLFLAAASAIALLSFASCEDMLAPDSDMVMYEEDNTLSSANDTLYSVMGVVHLMQQVADRTNLLGEVRSDLVTVTPSATTDMQALAAGLATTDNAYNRPEDYYAIVNNCNFFIQTADTGYTKYGQKVFERELAVMHTFRAWAYLQLATTYGNIPFYTDFLGTLASAEAVMKQPRQDINTVCNYLIKDLEPFITTYALDYGAINEFSSRNFFIPVRIMLGELCLWAGRYQEAAMYYHDYLADLNHPRPTETLGVRWSTDEKPAIGTRDSYSLNVTAMNTGEVLAYIPMEENVFDGTISYLDDIYNSTHDNDYYYQLTWSEAQIRLSASQSYYYEYVENNKRDTVCMTADTIVTRFNDRKQIGDLRLWSVAKESSVASGTKYNETFQTIRKISGDYIVPLYRLTTIYLHYAEALNRAGYPSAAFAVLKYGLSNETTMRPEGDVIADYEREAAGELIRFRQQDFDRTNTQGIHSRGCGDASVNPEYVLPMPADTTATPEQIIAYQQPRVEDMIIDELALETSFEGQRYYDLLRIALRRSDPAYLADRIAARDGEVNTSLRDRLMKPENWYLPLPAQH